MRDEKELLHAVQLARDEVNRQNADLARQYLASIETDINQCVGTQVWAEYQLTLAETLASMRDPTARSEAPSEFEEALRRISNLSERNLPLELRAHDHFARFLASIRRRSLARTHYEVAKRIAIEAGLKEETARVQLQMMKNDLECDEDPQLASFQNLRRAARELGATQQQQLAAWLQYRGEAEQFSCVVVAARKGDVASVQYFRSLLISVR